MAVLGGVHKKSVGRRGDPPKIKHNKNALYFNRNNKTKITVCAFPDDSFIR